MAQPILKCKSCNFVTGSSQIMKQHEINAHQSDAAQSTNHNSNNTQKPPKLSGTSKSSQRAVLPHSVPMPIKTNKDNISNADIQAAFGLLKLYASSED
eukprot:773714_1